MNPPNRCHKKNAALTTHYLSWSPSITTNVQLITAGRLFYSFWMCRLSAVHTYSQVRRRYIPLRALLI
jgi:hypothetical protein